MTVATLAMTVATLAMTVATLAMTVAMLAMTVAMLAMDVASLAGEFRCESKPFTQALHQGRHSVGRRCGNARRHAIGSCCRCRG